MIESPDHLPLPEEAMPAWTRITTALAERDAWLPIYASAAYVAATQVWFYLACCRIYGPAAALTRETQSIARLWLVDLECLTSALPTRFDDTARDLDLVELGAPLETDGAS